MIQMGNPQNHPKNWIRITGNLKKCKMVLKCGVFFKTCEILTNPNPRSMECGLNRYLDGPQPGK